MSRTKKGKPGPGKEYWGRRQGMKMSNAKGTEGKRTGIQKERAALKRETKKMSGEGDSDE